MSELSKHLCVLFWGSVSSFLTAVAILLMAYFLGFHLFFFNFHLMPIGAALCGGIAGMGYCLSCRYVDRLFSLMSVFDIAVISLLMQWFIYFLQYIVFLKANNADVSFLSWLLSFLETYQLSYSSSHPFFALGHWAWVAILAQSIGSVFGGLFVLFSMLDMPVCLKCRVFFKYRGKVRIRRFVYLADAERFVMGFKDKKPFSYDFMDHITNGFSELSNVGGMIYCTFAALKCHKCGQEVLSLRSVDTQNRKEQVIKSLSFLMTVPKHTSIVSYFERPDVL